IYIFRAETLEQILNTETGSDFGHDIIPAAIASGKRVYAYPFTGFWMDIGTIRSYYEINLAMAGPNPPFDTFSAEWPIYTRPRYLPGSRVLDSSLMRVLLAPGCRLEQSAIADSVIGLRSIIHKGAHLHRVVMLGADDFETLAQLEENERLGLPDIGVGAGSVIEGSILDKNVRIGRNVVIRNHTGSANTETETYAIVDGIVVVPKGSVIPDNTVISALQSMNYKEQRGCRSAGTLSVLSISFLRR
ncbi:MAG: hypothetical protein E4H27_07570, partial [Anaerolineales bacterium]